MKIKHELEFSQAFSVNLNRVLGSGCGHVGYGGMKCYVAFGRTLPGLVAMGELSTWRRTMIRLFVDELSCGWDCEQRIRLIISLLE